MLYFIISVKFIMEYIIYKIIKLLLNTKTKEQI